ncbi:methylated-DNA--[protein]-cysteine S-methyltransferase [Usitatibacter palustris]|uniref:Methylated-DNA--protein-cysteine methyltransferase n=1 Tax=Usitatibacter palustris TaxID=2732487 RepID=A0A6M4HD03_9PROT|nr:methylated-DNA--[protein]-cysteine S-methyltransferase [Usitatibacter palustris]QJR16608.1 Methylated-DNA--protein-cysteine methyltransferase [Usitatibacter palustris]
MPEAFQACVRTPFATVGIRATDKHITHFRFLAPTVPALAPPRNSLAYLACVQLQAYLDDPKRAFDLPLLMSGTHHRIAVWEAMCRIPAGKTRTYGEVAQELKSSPRAVGGACGANPLPIVVPCHRIVAASGLGGFMGARDEGFELGIKHWLLEHEGALRG